MNREKERNGKSGKQYNDRYTRKACIRDIHVRTRSFPSNCSVCGENSLCISAKHSYDERACEDFRARRDSGIIDLEWNLRFRKRCLVANKFPKTMPLSWFAYLYRIIRWYIIRDLVKSFLRHFHNTDSNRVICCILCALNMVQRRRI